MCLDGVFLEHNLNLPHYALRVTPQPRIAIISPAPLLIPFKPLWQNIAIILVKNTKYTPIEDQVRLLLLLLGNIPKMEVTDC
jgi:hypothetical protein